MIWESPLSAEQMMEMLDNAPVAIYVSAIDSYELLYANRMAKELLSLKPDTQGLTCYQAAGFDKPCPFCHTGEMNCSGSMTREYLRPADGRIYQLSGKLINWGSQPAHIECILDITDKRRKENQTKALKEELQSIFSSIPCGLCVYQFEEGQFSPVFHNPAFYEIMGYSPEHIGMIEQKTNFLGVHPDDLTLLRNKILEVIRQNGSLQHSYRLWNDQKGEYRWILLEGTVKPREDGSKLLYGVYKDVSEQMRLEKELTAANEKMQGIVNAIPGGVAIYKVSDIFETLYFSDGVPELSGYTVEEYHDLCKRDAAEMTYPEDTTMVIENLQRAIQNHTVADFEFRKLHRDGHIVWVHIQAKQIGEEDGCPLIQCVFHNISALKEAELEMDHLINSIPGGIASYRVEENCFIPTFYSDGVMALTGRTREEFEAVMQHDSLDFIYVLDRERVLSAINVALESGDVLDVSYRIQHKNGNLIWIHMNGRRMGPLSENMKFYAVYTGMSAETHLFQSIADESADGIYVIDRKNYDLLYINESKSLFKKGKKCLGLKCYTALHGKSSPCDFCTLKTHQPNGKEHEMLVDEKDRFYTTRFRETDWNGMPAYIKYVHDVTNEVRTRKEKERLEEYFQTVIKNLPGGVSVVRYEKDGSMKPEFLSDGFAAMTGMSLDEAWQLYRENAMAGVHPDDRAKVIKQMNAYILSGKDHWEIIYRLKKGNGGYLWVKNTLSLIQNGGGESRVYAVYHDITEEQEAQKKIRRQYNELILQHYHTPGPNALMVGHCNITQNKIMEIIDYTDSNLEVFLPSRETFFTNVASFIVDEQERQAFLNTYLNDPALASFHNNETERIMDCFMKLPGKSYGCYVQIKMNMIAAPDSGDVTGILTVMDITDQTISDRILHQISVTGYDFAVDLDLIQDSYMILSFNKNAFCVPPQQGCHSERVKYMLASRVVPRDKEQYQKALDSKRMLQRLEKEHSYTFAFSITDDNEDIRTKNMTVTAVDLRLGRVCLSQTDITDSLREQQGLLNMIAYTFELAGFVDLGSRRLTIYTRETILNNLPPYYIERYDDAIPNFVNQYGTDENRQDAHIQFQINTILEHLEQQPNGYEFLFSYRSGSNERYKQINVLWGDVNHKTICLVRADVTDMLTSERQAKKSLESALALAQEASQAKSDFFSAMSHDIRTPMNAIMGMTALAVAHLDDRTRVEDCLKKISISSKHLLSLINDVLDMSKIERSRIVLNHMRISISELLEQLSAMMTPQAKTAGLQFNIRAEHICHEHFNGDPLRINQILINLLSNAVKFTPEGGEVNFSVVEIPPVTNTGTARYQFTVSDTGIGMSPEFLSQIFDPFTRSNQTARIEGTGLGLSITKGLVDLMDGKISVESREHLGSTFRVELECEIAQREEEFYEEDDEKASSGPSREKIFAGYCFLIAEDNAINAEILRELLRMYGAKSVLKTDGVQTVQAFRKAEPGTYDAILMDIQMPEMNGYTATRTIREMSRADAKSIPIIAMTANAFAEDIQTSLQAGMNAHVAKPIDVNILQNTLCKILKNEEK